MWLPLVMQPTPSAFTSSRMSLVTPKPAAAFSTLTITKSIPMEETISGRRSLMARRPGEPKMSATKRMFTRASAGVFHGARLADHHDLDLPRVLELPLHAAGDVARELRGARG